MKGAAQAQRQEEAGRASSTHFWIGSSASPRAPSRRTCSPLECGGCFGPVLCYSTGVAMAPTGTDAARVARTSSRRSRAAHKGQMGRIAVLGGSLEYTARRTAPRRRRSRSGPTSPGSSPRPRRRRRSRLQPRAHRDPGTGRALAPSTRPRAGRVARFVEGVRGRLRLHALVIGPGLGRDAAALEARRRRARGRGSIVTGRGLHLVTGGRA